VRSLQAFPLCVTLLLASCSGSDGQADSGAPPPDLRPPDLAPPDHSPPLPDRAGPDLVPLADLAIDSPRPDLGPPAPCGPASPAYSGALCGPPSSPCKIKRNELVQTVLSGYASGLAVESSGQVHLFIASSASKAVRHRRRDNGK